jgi:hypothetical protein
VEAWVASWEVRLEICVGSMVASWTDGTVFGAVMCYLGRKRRSDLSFFASNRPPISIFILPRHGEIRC